MSFQERAGDCFDPVRLRLRQGKGRIRNSGADYLAHALLDALIDSYFPLLKRCGEVFETMEQEVFEAPAAPPRGRSCATAPITSSS